MGLGIVTRGPWVSGPPLAALTPVASIVPTAFLPTAHPSHLPDTARGSTGPPGATEPGPLLLPRNTVQRTEGLRPAGGLGCPDPCRAQESRVAWHGRAWHSGDLQTAVTSLPLSSPPGCRWGKEARRRKQKGMGLPAGGSG